MIKYIVPLLALTACNSAPKTYVCVNPFMVLQSVALSTADPNVKDKGDTLEAVDGEGRVAVFPKSLCAEIK